MSYLVEIDYPSLVEFIDEKFDNITNLLTSNAVMYGSSITSLISGIKSDGDLDVSISPLEYSTLLQRLHDSEKWLQIDGAAPGWKFSWKAKPKLKNPYEDIPDFPLSETVSFKTVSGAVVQIIRSKSASGDPLHDSLEVVRKVDFAFCGMAMDRYGRLLETIPNSFSDCKAGVIRVANYRAGEDLERVRGRLDKYVKRGWSLSASYDTIFDGYRRKDKELEEAKAKEQLKKKTTKKKPGKQEFKFDGYSTGRISSSTTNVYYSYGSNSFWTT